MSVEAIKEAILGLPEKEQVALACWLNVQTMDEWDREMLRDFSAGGNGMEFAKRVKLEIAEGKAQPVADGFKGRRPRT